MKKQAFALLAGGALLAFASTVYAAEPMRLTDNQMDKVSAGSTAIANAANVAIGEAFADTASQTSTYVQLVTLRDPTTNAVVSTPIVVSQAAAQAIAGGGFLFQSLAASHSSGAAIW